MANATRWYTSREAVKAASGIEGSGVDSLVDTYIEAASENVEDLLQSRGTTRFIPVTETRLYPWPQNFGSSLTTYLDADLLAVTTLQSKAQDSSPTTIAATDYFLEPVNKPPYRRIEIDRSSSASFEAGDTTQRSISVAGRWGYSEETKAAGTLVGALSDTTGTTVVCSRGNLIDVGDTILIDSEAMFVSGRSLAAEPNGDLLDDASVTADYADVSITVDDASRYADGEVIQVNSEKMRIEARNETTEVLTVKRAYDGSTLAAHANNDPVNVFRTLTVVRGVNGTTAATHSNGATITKYVPPAVVQNYCRAWAILNLKQGESGWTGQINLTEGGQDVDPAGLNRLRQTILELYGRTTI